MSSPSNVDGADIINSFLQDLERSRQSRFSSSAIGALDNSMQVPRSQYPNSLMISELDNSRPRGTGAYAPSVGSSESGFIADLERFEEETHYSISTAPSRRGVEPLHRQRPTIPDLETPLFESTLFELPGPRLPCEFYWYTDCDVVFELDQDAAWVQHVVSEHLHEMLPKYCICWFCDETDFNSRSDGFEDKKNNYATRIRHISHHFRQGQTLHKVRPDYFFLDHIHNYGLISEAMFQRTKRYHEVPQPRNGINATPFPWGRQPTMAVEVRPRRRGRSESRRSYRD